MKKIAITMTDQMYALVRQRALSENRSMANYIRTYGLPKTTSDTNSAQRTPVAEPDDVDLGEIEFDED